MKRMRWDDLMSDFKTIDRVHIHPGDERRGWDGMIRWEIFKTIDQVHVRSREAQIRWLEASFSTSSNGWRTLWASTIVMFRNSTTLWSVGLSRTLMISSFERNFLSHRRLKPHSVTGNSATINITTGATPHLPSHQGMFYNSVDMYSSGPDPFPRIAPPSPRSCS